MTIHPAVIHRYQVVERIGQGGMGAVYLARDPVLDRPVAIKLLRGDLDTELLRERFFREARAAASLSHVNIVAVFDVGEHEGQPFIAMEYIHGETVRDLLARRAELPLAQRLIFMKDLCAGLAHAHKSGIVHRDVKPANLIVTPEQTLKILDFGIARVRDSRMTELGALMGTVSYMSPEQSLGLAVDHRADVFAVGAVFYELLTYCKAFPGQIEDGVLHRIQYEQPVPLDTLVAGLDPAIVRIVSKALEKDRNRRYDDLAVMRRDIIKVLKAIEERGGEDSTRLLLDAPGAAGRAGRPAQAVAASPTPPGGRAGDRGVFARRRAAEIESRLQAARTAMASADYEAAVASCEEALFLDPDNVEADETREKARAALLARDVGRLLAEARGLVDRGSLTSAGAVLDRVAELDPASDEAVTLREEIARARQERELARQRQAAVEEGLRHAAVALQQGRMEDVLRTAEAVLTLDARSAAAVEFRDRAAAAIEEARRKEEHDRAAAAAVAAASAQFEAGDRAGAVAALAAFRPPHELVSQAVVALAERAKKAEEEQRRVERERAERERRLAGLAAEGRALVRESRFDEAIGRVAEMRRIDPSLPEADEIAALARAGQEEARRRHEHERAAAAAVADASRLFEAGEHTRALAALAAFRPPHDLVSQAAAALAERLREIDAGQRRAEQERAERERTMLSLAGRARAAIGRGEFDEALALVGHLREMDPDGSQAPSLEAEAQEGLAAEERRQAHDRAAAEMVQTARARFRDGDRSSALSMLSAFRPLHPLVTEAVLGLADEARRLDEERRVTEQYRVEVERRVIGWVTAARTAIAEGRFERASEAIQRIREIDPAASEARVLDAEADEARTAARRRDEHDRAAREAVAAARKRFDEGDPAGALAELSDFRPAHDLVSMALLQLGQEAQQIDEARRRAVREKVETERRLLACVVTARAALADGRVDQAAEIVQQMRAIDPEAKDAAALSFQIQAERSRREAERDATVPAPPPPSVATPAAAAPAPTPAPPSAPPAAVLPVLAAPAQDVQAAVLSAPTPPDARHWSSTPLAMSLPEEPPEEAPAVLRSFERTATEERADWRRVAIAVSVLVLILASVAGWWSTRATPPATTSPPVAPAQAEGRGDSPGSAPGPDTARPAPRGGMPARAGAAAVTRASDAGSALAQIASQQLANDDKKGALETIERGLVKRSADKALLALLDDLDSEARRDLLAARLSSVQAGVEASPKFREAKSILDGAVGRPKPDIVRAYWSARSLFDEARSLAQPAAPAQAVPRSVPQPPPSAASSNPSPAATRPAVAPGSAAAGAPIRDEDEQAIRQVLARWKAAMEMGSTAELKRLQENLTLEEISGIENVFLTYPTRSVDLKVLVISSAAPGVATVRCALARTMRPANRAQAERRVSEAVTFRLEKRVDWRIVETKGFTILPDR